MLRRPHPPISLTMLHTPGAGQRHELGWEYLCRVGESTDGNLLLYTGTVPPTPPSRVSQYHVQAGSQSYMVIIIYINKYISQLRPITHRQLQLDIYIYPWYSTLTPSPVLQGLCYIIVVSSNIPMQPHPPSSPLITTIYYTTNYVLYAWSYCSGSCHHMHLGHRRVYTCMYSFFFFSVLLVTVLLCELMNWLAFDASIYM